MVASISLHEILFRSHRELAEFKMLLLVKRVKNSEFLPRKILPSNRNNLPSDWTEKRISPRNCAPPKCVWLVVPGPIPPSNPAFGSTRFQATAKIHDADRRGSCLLTSGANGDKKWGQYKVHEKWRNELNPRGHRY